MKQVIKIPSLGDAENTEVIEICVNPGDSVGSEDSIVVLESVSYTHLTLPTNREV